MSKFLKVTDVQLANGGYLSTGKDNLPINHGGFVKAQKHAEYICTFAELAKGKDFEGKKADSLDDLKAKVAEALATKATVYVKAPKKVSQKTTKAVADEAMAFMNWKEESSKAEKMNEFLQQFDVLNDFEVNGLFFEDGIVKLNKIYTMKEIIKAVETTIDLVA